jgi:hypothetical protein
MRRPPENGVPESAGGQSHGIGGSSVITLKAQIPKEPSRALWIVKWLLLIPHVFVLVFLAIGFAGATIIAFFAILFTGRYPRGLFNYSLGFLRWGWRVAYYGYGALSTDRYPPFSLDSVEDYPADLQIDYPEHLRQWMPLVKWLLAVPHFMVLAVLFGGTCGGKWVEESYQATNAGYPGLLFFLVLFIAFVLLFTGKVNRDLHTLAVGVNRWGIRVAAYVALLTDEYPPFRLTE